MRALKRNKLSNLDSFHAAIVNLDNAGRTKYNNFRLQRLFEYLGDICTVANKQIVLMIDEVDSASNNQVFLDFLAQLRAYYIDRDIQPTFQSVILASVYDVKNLKMKIRPDDYHKINSPWNIAADFNINMSFQKEEIAGMIAQYEEDYHTGMDINMIAALIYNYTSGYPFLVSRLCKLIDEEVCKKNGFRTKDKAWTRAGFIESVKMILTEKIHFLNH